MKNRSGLHIWSVSWPLASRGTHPVVSDYAILEKYLRAQRGFETAYVFIRLVLLPRPVLSRNLAIGGKIFISLQWEDAWIMNETLWYLGWWGVIPHHGAGAWRRWRCTMTQGNIAMESPTQGTTNIRGDRLSIIVSGHKSTQWPCVSWKHVLGTLMRSSECLKPSTCYLTWTGELWHSR